MNGKHSPLDLAKAESTCRLQAAGFSVESIHGGLRIRHGEK